VSGLPSNDNRLDMDGQQGTDNYTINVTGASDYVVNVHDSGAADDGGDRLEINGTAGDDTFLVRKYFVANLQATESGFADDFERINYDETINARLRVNGLDGDDSFYVDDNCTITTLSGGAGSDTFQIGQMFGAEREDPYVAAGDEIETTETTLGWLSNGISLPTVVYGGEGDDLIRVYSNKAELKLFGESGNDEFVVRAFLAKDSDAVVGGGDTDLYGGDGDDNIQYTINSPVNIDGGSGNDLVVVLGTNADDSFVVTNDGIYGAGLNVSFSDVERAEVDGLEGDDTFYILSTDAGVETTVIGGLGSDTFNVGGDVVNEIVSSPTTGLSSYINHAVTSDDPAYDGIYVDGLSLDVATPDNTTVLLSATEVELDDSHEGSYTLKMLADVPDVATVAYLTISASRTSSDTDNRGKILVSLDGVNYYESLVVTFDSTTNWTDGHTVYVRATAEAAADLETNVVINHSMLSDNEEFNGAAVANVELATSFGGTATPTDSLVDIQWTSGTGVISPEAGGSYSIVLTQQPTADVVIALLGDGQTLLSSSAANFDPNTNTVTFTPDNWDQAVEIQVEVNPAADSAASTIQNFPTQPHSVAGVDGDLIIVGGVQEGSDRSLVTAVTLPSEGDEPLQNIDIDTDESLQTDTLNVFNDGTLAAATGSLSADEISGLGMDGTIQYGGVEVVDVMLGRGNDTFTVTGSAAGTITLIQGGGGDDSLYATGGGGSEAPLILAGDTLQDGWLYDSTTAAVTGGAREYATAGNDFIDASDATQGVIIYGGVGDDTLYGGSGGDQIAGGSGDDLIYGGAGNDHIYGDSGFNLDLSLRLDRGGQVLTVVNTAADTDNMETRDDLGAGSDEIHGGAGEDIVFGDYGVITQTDGTRRILTTGGVVRIETVNDELGTGDSLYGDAGDDILMGGQGSDDMDGGDDDDLLFGDNGVAELSDGRMTSVYTTDTTTDTGAGDTLHGGNGNDILFGGVGSDGIYGDGGDDIALGDNGEVSFDGLGRVQQVTSGDPRFGGDDHMEGGDGNDLLIGGAFTDDVDGGAGDDFLVGDAGRGTYRNGVFYQIETLDRDRFIGGDDTLTGGSGFDIMLGGHGSDFFHGDFSEDLMIGEYARVTLNNGRVEYLVRLAQGNQDLIGNRQFKLYHGVTTPADEAEKEVRPITTAADGAASQGAPEGPQTSVYETRPNHHGASTASAALGYYAAPDDQTQPPAAPAEAAPAPEQVPAAPAAPPEMPLPPAAEPPAPAAPAGTAPQEETPAAAPERGDSGVRTDLGTLVAGFAGWGIASGRRAGGKSLLTQEDLDRFSRPRLRSWRWEEGRLRKSGAAQEAPLSRPLVEMAGFSVERNRVRNRADKEAAHNP
jgi:hypothetical protein